MKVLLFTHKSDIDGMGSAVLAKLAFEDVDYVLCETFNLQNEILKYYSDGCIYNYDAIFVTDLWLEEPMLTRVANDRQLKNKFFVFDHHKSVLEGNFNKYPFETIRISDEKGLCSGTSLFYEYLISNNLIASNNKAIQDFSELTRKYDTWEWKTKYDDEIAHELSLLFDSVGSDGYIELMYQKLSKESINEFKFNELERMLIKNNASHIALYFG